MADGENAPFKYACTEMRALEDDFFKEGYELSIDDERGSWGSSHFIHTPAIPASMYYISRSVAEEGQESVGLIRA